MYSSYSSSTATDMDYQKHSADPPQLRSGNPPVQTPPGTEAPWSTGLFSCFDDVPNCTFAFPLSISVIDPFFVDVVWFFA